MSDPLTPHEKPKRHNLVDDLATLFRPPAKGRTGALRLEKGKGPFETDELADDVFGSSAGVAPAGTGSAARPSDTPAEAAPAAPAVPASAIEEKGPFETDELVGDVFGTPGGVTYASTGPAVPPGDSDTPAKATRADLASLVAGIDERVRNRETLAPLVPAERRKRGTAQNRYVVFRLGPTACAFPLRSVSEIGRLTRTTPVPRTPSWIRGLTNLRGEILSVADLRLFAGFSPGPGREIMMVARSSGNEVVVALLVDQVTGLARLPDDQISPVPVDFRGDLAPYLAGLAEHSDAVLAVFDPDRLLLAPRFLTLE